MHLENVLAYEPLAAHLALVRPFPRVYPGVDLETLLRAERLVTEIALVRLLLSSVCSSVSPEVVFLGVRLVALITLEGVAARVVLCRVEDKLVVRREQFLTIPASERLECLGLGDTDDAGSDWFAPRHGNRFVQLGKVCDQGTVIAKCLRALWALIGEWSAVVCIVFPRCFEARPTAVALVWLWAHVNEHVIGKTVGTVKRITAQQTRGRGKVWIRNYCHVGEGTRPSQVDHDV